MKTSRLVQIRNTYYQMLNDRKVDNGTPIWFQIDEALKAYLNQGEPMQEVAVTTPAKKAKKEATKKEPKTMVRPDYAEVLNQFISNAMLPQYAEKEAHKFILHFETVGWLVGKNKTPMKSWKGAVAMWCLRLKEKDSEPADSASNQNYNERHTNVDWADNIK